MTIGPYLLQIYTIVNIMHVAITLALAISSFVELFIYSVIIFIFISFCFVSFTPFVAAKEQIWIIFFFFVDAR